jgi:hypothetical protein
VMNCRRFMASSRLRLKAYHGFGQPEWYEALRSVRWGEVRSA